MTSTWTPAHLNSTGWKPEPGGWYHHGNAGMPWYLVRLTGWRHRITHRCRAHSVGIHGWAVMLRCICGAIREGVANPGDHFRHNHPGDTPGLQFTFIDGWRERNSRYRGTAMFYHPHMHPLTEVGHG